ncbi:MAG: NUDIX domain-containing protein [Patescibacteria group bacterium]|jgi:8-oxo-dGTP pyrophosphatase MutT (NUDIX family)
MPNDLKHELEEVVNSEVKVKDEVREKFYQRLEIEGLVREENIEDHFACFFLAYDKKYRQVLIGHHKKAGLWLFNGGHIEKGESLEATVTREISEEWGLDFKDVGSPKLLTITDINNPARQKCRRHYDLWYFFEVDKDSFTPNKELLAIENHETKWLDVAEVRKLNTSTQTLEALDFIESELFSL